MSDDRFLKNYFLHKKTDFIHKTDVQDFSFNFCFMAGICRYILPYSAIFPIIRVVYWGKYKKTQVDHCAGYHYNEARRLFIW